MNGFTRFGSGLTRWLRADWCQTCSNAGEYWGVLKEAKRHFTELGILFFAAASIARLLQGRGLLPTPALTHQNASFFHRLTDAGTQYLLHVWPLWLSLLALGLIVGLGAVGILRRYYWMRYAAMSIGFIYCVWLGLDVLVHTGVAGTAYSFPAVLCWGVASQVMRFSQDEKDKAAGVYPRVRQPSPWAWTLRLRGKYGILGKYGKPRAGVKSSLGKSAQGPGTQGESVRTAV